MALIECRFFSEVLEMSSTMTVILPENNITQIGMNNRQSGDKYPTLFLLHGFSDDDSIWLRRTSIERYSANLGLAIVMPNVHHSFYTDMIYGHKYWTFLTEELPRTARSFFPLSEAREHTFAAGLSMGGYGAFKWALRHPDRIAAAASLSGVVDIVSRKDKSHENPIMERSFDLIFGDRELEGTPDDLLWLLGQNGKLEPKPLLYQCCGTEDFLYEENQTFLHAARENAFDLIYEEGPGDHTWEYWDAKIQNVLKWLPLPKLT